MFLRKLIESNGLLYSLLVVFFYFKIVKRVLFLKKDTIYCCNWKKIFIIADDGCNEILKVENIDPNLDWNEWYINWRVRQTANPINLFVVIRSSISLKINWRKSIKHTWIEIEHSICNIINRISCKMIFNTCFKNNDDQN